MTGSPSNQKPKFLTFIVILVGLYLLTGWAAIALLQPTPQPFSGSVGAGGAVSVIEWWQYLLFGFYNTIVWIAAYFLATKVVPRFFS